MGKSLSNTRLYKAGRVVIALFEQYDHLYLPEDPVSLIHPFSDPKDQEIVALLTALLAFGNAKSIRASVQKILLLLGPHPYEFIRSFEGDKHLPLFERLGHRWVWGADLHRLFLLLKGLLGRYPSLEACFLEGYCPQDPDVSGMLDQFSKRILKEFDKASLTRGFRYFFPSPQDGSPCKRLNMFLRWVVRPADGVDLGLWKEISPAKLLVPLDTHLYQFAKKFGLSRYQNPNWRMARDVTDFLLTLDPLDPVKYDFAICHYGMEYGWQKPLR